MQLIWDFDGTLRYDVIIIRQRLTETVGRLLEKGAVTYDEGGTLPDRFRHGLHRKPEQKEKM